MGDLGGNMGKLIIKGLLGWVVGAIIAIIIVLAFNIQTPAICSGIGFLFGITGGGFGVLTEL